MRTSLTHDEAMRLGFKSLDPAWLKCLYCEKAVRSGREAKVHLVDCPHRPRMERA